MRRYCRNGGRRNTSSARRNAIPQTPSGELTVYNAVYQSNSLNCSLSWAFGQMGFYAACIMELMEVPLPLRVAFHPEMC
jgi:hypothetical protein